MSTTILNAYKFNTPPTLFQLNDWCDKVSDDIHNILDESFEERIIKWVYKITFKDALIIKNILNANDEDKDRMTKGLPYKVHSRANILDELDKDREDAIRSNDVQISFYTYKDDVFLTIFCPIYEIKEKVDIYFKNMDGISSFEYWNNTDKPDEISQREWNKREKIWDSILEGSSSKKQVGFYKNIVDGRFIHPYMPDNSVFSKYSLNDKEFEDIIFNLCQFSPIANYSGYLKSQGVDPFKSSASDYMRFVRSLKKGENEEFNKLIKYVKNYLSIDMPEHVLTGTFKDVKAFYEKKIISSQMPDKDTTTKKLKI